jgi:hypothetical protein
MPIAQATGEAINPQKRKSSTSKLENSFFLFLWVIFTLLDPDPQPWLEGESSSMFLFYFI